MTLRARLLLVTVGLWVSMGACTPVPKVEPPESEAQDVAGDTAVAEVLEAGDSSPVSEAGDAAVEDTAASPEDTAAPPEDTAVAVDTEPVEDAILPGAALYDAYCGMCHGPSGEGYQSDQANALSNPNFLAAASDDFLRAAIIHGRPGTPMPAWGIDYGGPLVDAHVDDLVALMRSWQVGESAELSEEPIEGDAVAGQAVYKSACHSCHGAQGEGGTYMTLSNPWFLETASDAFLRHAIHDGRPGTPMPAFGEMLTETELDDLVALIRSWAEPPVDEPIESYSPDLSQPWINPGGPPADFELSEERFVSMAQVVAAMSAGEAFVILDARPSSDFLYSHIQGAISVPYFDVEAQAGSLPQDAWIVTYCGCPHMLSGMAFDTLKDLGFQDVAVLDEGFWAWEAASHPVGMGP